MRSLTRVAGLTGLTLIAGLGLAGCGKSPSSAPPPANAGPSAALAGATPTAAPASMSSVAVCQLLTKTEVEAATGVKVGEVREASTDGSKEPKCLFLHADTANYGSTEVASISLTRPGKVGSMKQVWGTMMKTTPVEGVGDFAFLSPMGPALFAGKADRAVVVQLLDGGSPEQRAEEIKTLAKAAVGRL